jgi:hypothetical protein
MILGGVVAEYLNNADLAAEIAVCQKTMVVSDRLARMLVLLVNRIGSKAQFRNYSFVEDMKCEALLQLVRRNAQQTRNDQRPNILKFDQGYAARRGTKPNPFSYATQIVTNIFRRQIKVEQGMVGLRDDILEANRKTPSARRQIYNDEHRSSEPIPPPQKVGPGRGRKKKAIVGVVGVGSVN